MFDESFSGDNPPVDSIDWDFNILNERNLTDAQGNALRIHSGGGSRSWGSRQLTQCTDPSPGGSSTVSPWLR